MISSKQIRRQYIDFFKNFPGREHVEIPSASLIPENDPSVLFTTAGMHPLVPFLLGEKHPAGPRLVNCQKCIRTGDIDAVGDKVHLTFFEMLGHWSLGDPASPDGIGPGGYFKKEAIEMSYQFLTEELGLDPKRLAFSVFAGDEHAPSDEEAQAVWKSLGVSEKRIKTLSKKENWWELGGPTGPCGPDTEMFYWADNNEPASAEFDPTDSRWVEIGNDVLMQYEKQSKDKYMPARQKNIDNGTGLERLVAVLNNLDDTYQTDLFLPIITKIEELSGKKYGANEEIARSMRIIADHLRAATFIIGDDQGIIPSNVDQGYVVRKLIRRAIRHGKLLGINDIFCFKIAEVVIDIMHDIYPELKNNKEFIINQMVVEEEKFRKTLDNGLRELNKYLAGREIRNAKNIIFGKAAFYFYQTYGLPPEVIKEISKAKQVEVEEFFDENFEQAMKKHQKMSRTAAAGKFKGGLANQSKQVIKYHTAAHLMLAALRQVLGDHVSQKGSNITEERMRFDFSHAEKMTEEEKQKVEELVNGWILADLPVSCEEISLEQAKAIGATGVFDSKYGNQVKVYTIGQGANIISREICGGPHVDHTSVLGHFRISKEQSSSAGIRRIKAVLE